MKRMGCCRDGKGAMTCQQVAYLLTKTIKTHMQAYTHNTHTNAHSQIGRGERNKEIQTVIGSMMASSCLEYCQTQVFEMGNTTCHNTHKNTHTLMFSQTHIHSTHAHTHTHTSAFRDPFSEHTESKRKLTLLDVKGVFQQSFISGTWPISKNNIKKHARPEYKYIQPTIKMYIKIKE